MRTNPDDPPPDVTPTQVRVDLVFREKGRRAPLSVRAELRWEIRSR